MSKAAGTESIRSDEGSWSTAAAGIQRWRSALSWQRAVDKELRASGLSLTRWLVLHAADSLIRSSGDAVSNRAVAQYAGMVEMTVSRVMDSLVDRGWVSRDICSVTPAWRVLLTTAGRSVLAEGRERIEVASARWSGR